MPWVRLDDGFADHPKIEAAGPLAGWLHVAALCYCARHLTDGRVPKNKARRLTDIPQPIKHIAALLDARLWTEDGDEYVIHDYLDYQPSRAEIEKDREAAKERMAEARRRKREAREAAKNGSGEHAPNVPANNERSSPEVRSTGVRSTPSRPVPSRENDARGGHSPALALVPTPPTAPPAPDRPTPTSSSYPTDFEAWWTLYPVKKGKHDAARAWRRARGHATWNQLTNGLRAATAAWQAERREPRFIPRAATWLNGRCWEDDHDTPPLTRPEPKGFAGVRAALEQRGSA